MLHGEDLDRPTYRILHTIGDGTQGVCRHGVHDVFKKDVVQKTVSLLGVPDSVVRTTEPEILKDIRHDRIVDVWEAQWDPDPALRGLNAVTFVMPYYPEGSVFQALVDGQRFGVGDTIRIGADVMSALDEMHIAHRLVHRDVKPANVLLEDSRRHACLSDLGSAASIDAATGGASSHVGSPLYQAPEARPSKVTTPRADIYAVGMMMLEMLNGPLPYEEINVDADALEARLEAGRRAVVDRYFELDPWVPKPLAHLVRSITSRDPSRRPESAAAAWRSLTALRLMDWRRQDGDGVTGRWVGYWPPAARAEARRITEITIDPIDRGAHKGKWLAQARWRRPNSAWRNYARLTKRIEPTRTAVSEYFRAVEAVAQTAPTR